tara:strand:+ start:5529 stop:7154 length:1626 start_codon:yes stop_codon:yes gene_type:complete
MLDDNSNLLTKWNPVLEGISNDYTRKVTAQLLENQAKSIIAEKNDRVDEADAPTTVGKLGTFQKFAFPLVRRVYPQLIANQIVGVQPMGGPVSQIFYLGADRVAGAWGRTETIYSKYRLTYGGKTAGAVFRAPGDLTGSPQPAANLAGSDTNAYSSVIGNLSGAPSTTMGGQIASWPDASTILGYSVSAGEALSGDEIPEMNLHIEQQPVVSRTRKMRALWTLEAAQDLRAYHNLDLEGELTDLLSKELTLEIDRELIEDLRMIAYDPSGISGWNRQSLDMANSNNFQGTGRNTPQSPANGLTTTAAGAFTPTEYLYDFANAGAFNPSATNSNVYLFDMSGTFMRQSSPFAPQHVGQIYANLLAAINFASMDIYRTTFRGPGSWMITSPLIASMLESAAKLEGGMPERDRPSNIGDTAIAYKGKFAGRYDLYVDPMYPEDEIMIGYKGSGPMDAGYVYCPYIPLQQLPTITDPQTFQPRKGILTRYGKAAVTPESRFYRIIRLIGANADFMFQPTSKPSNANAGAAAAFQNRNVVVPGPNG